jgi:hypothetical protein
MEIVLEIATPKGCGVAALREIETHRVSVKIGAIFAEHPCSTRNPEWFGDDPHSRYKSLHQPHADHSCDLCQQ